jgi:hypothetical protein
LQTVNSDEYEEPSSDSATVIVDSDGSDDLAKASRKKPPYSAASEKTDVEDPMLDLLKEWVLEAMRGAPLAPSAIAVGFS